ncbi:unnamed protein product [Linum trigynum]|uniref:Uncharacterized protein n=1 Tax=Linum trigynum TaxID=586398 RepID=A0AAV2ES57_9ROSI
MFSAKLLPISSMDALIWSPMASIAPIEPFEASTALSVTSVRLSNNGAIASYLFVVTSLTVTISLFWCGGCGLSVGSSSCVSNHSFRKIGTPARL